MSIQVKSAPGGVLLELTSEEGGYSITATEFIPNEGLGLTVHEVIESLSIASDLSYELEASEL